MTRLHYAIRQAITTAAVAVGLGWMTNNPNWLALNLPLGLVAGYLVGLALWPLMARLHGWQR